MTDLNATYCPIVENFWDTTIQPFLVSELGNDLFQINTETASNLYPDNLFIFYNEISQFANIKILDPMSHTVIRNGYLDQENPENPENARNYFTNVNPIIERILNSINFQQSFPEGIIRTKTNFRAIPLQKFKSYIYFRNNYCVYSNLDIPIPICECFDNRVSELW